MCKEYPVEQDIWTSPWRRSRRNVLKGRAVLAGALLITVAGTVFIEGQAHSATTFTVNRTSDTKDVNTADNVCRDKDGRCSLRAAVEQANALPGHDVIKLDALTYKLTLVEEDKEPGKFNALPLVITDMVEILGVSTTSTVIDGHRERSTFKDKNGKSVDVRDIKEFYGVMQVRTTSPNGLNLQNLTITNGKNTIDIGGGISIYRGGIVVATRLAVTNSKTEGSAGGGVGVRGQFTCFDCTISGNSTRTGLTGGFMYTGGGVFLDNTGDAGAWLYGTTISGNKAVRGGGIAGTGYLECQNCTISGNTAIAGGGGLKTWDPANWWIAWSTITNNKANDAPSDEPALGGGVFHTGGTLQIGKTIIAGNSDGRDPNDKDRLFSPDCATTATEYRRTGSPRSGGLPGPYAVDRAINSHWDNIYGNLGYLCKATSASDGGDVSGFDGSGYGPYTIPVNLGALGGNGGSVQTHMLKPGSPAIDDDTSGNPWSFWLFDCPAVDAAKQSRPVGAACDSGSYEAQ